MHRWLDRRITAGPTGDAARQRLRRYVVRRWHEPGAWYMLKEALGLASDPNGQQGQIYFARCVLWKGAPTDLQLLAERDKLFPSHPTGNQFLSGELFDAYRALGWAVTEELHTHLQLPSFELDEMLKRHAAPQPVSAVEALPL